MESLLRGRNQKSSSSLDGAGKTGGKKKVHNTGMTKTGGPPSSIMHREQQKQ